MIDRTRRSTRSRSAAALLSALLAVVSLAAMGIAIPLLWESEPAAIGKRPLSGYPAPAPEGSKHVQIREHWIDGIQVTEAVVGRADVEDELPMIVFVHGRGSRPNLPEGDHTRSMPVRMMFPRAPDRLGDGYTWFPLSITAGRDEVLGHHIVEETEKLAAIVDRLREQRPTEGRPLVTGFSQGGMISFALALLHPEVVDSAYPICGWIPDVVVDEVEADAVFPLVRAVHGDEDPIVPFAPTRALIERLRGLGVDARIDRFPSDRHLITGPMSTRHRNLMLERIRERRSAARDLG